MVILSFHKGLYLKVSEEFPSVYTVRTRTCLPGYAMEIAAVNGKDDFQCSKPFHLLLLLLLLLFQYFSFSSAMS